MSGTFLAYQRMQMEVASQYDHVYGYDLWSALDRFQQERLVLDTNHLSMLGHQRLAESILEITSEVLFDEP